MMKRAVLISRWLLGGFLGIIVLAGCGNREPEATTTKMPEPVRGYACEDGFRFVVRPAGDLVRLATPEEKALNLTRAETDPEAGEKFIDSRAVFWRRGLKASLEMDGQVHENCAMMTPDSPADFEASGFEPGWHLAVERDGELVFTGDYGDFTVTTAAPEPEFHPKSGAVTYQADVEGKSLAVIIRDETCFEASGDPAPTAVSVRFGEREYQGCGTSRPELPESAGEK